MSATDAQLATAHEEAGHLLAGRSMGRTARGLFLSDEASLVQFEDGGHVSPDATIWTTVAGPVAKALYYDPSWRDFEGVAEHLLSGIDYDGRSILLAFQQIAEEEGRTFTREQAKTILAGRAERARKFLTEKSGELAQLVEDALAGKLTPRAYPEGAKVAYAHGQVIGYVQPEHVYMAAERGGSTHRQQEGLVKLADTHPPRLAELPLVDPFEAPPEPKPKAVTKPLRLIRDGAGRLLGIGGGDAD
jgi:hypothetical protein